MYYSIYPSPLPESQSLRVQKHLIFKGGMCVPLSLVMCLQKESLTTIWDSVYRKCLPRVCFLLSKWIPQKSNEKNCLNKRRNIKMLIQGKIEQLWKSYFYFSYSILLVSYHFSSCLFCCTVQIFASKVIYFSGNSKKVCGLQFTSRDKLSS